MKENDGSGEDFLDLLLSTNANWSKDVGLNQKKNRYFLCLCAFISAGQNLLQVSDSSRRQLDELKTWLNVRHKPHTRGEKILLYYYDETFFFVWPNVHLSFHSMWKQTGHTIWPSTASFWSVINNPVYQGRKLFFRFEQEPFLLLKSFWIFHFVIVLEFYDFWGVVFIHFVSISMLLFNFL